MPVLPAPTGISTGIPAPCSDTGPPPLTPLVVCAGGDHPAAVKNGVAPATTTMSPPFGSAAIACDMLASSVAPVVSPDGKMGTRSGPTYVSVPARSTPSFWAGVPTASLVGAPALPPTIRSCAAVMGLDMPTGAGDGAASVMAIRTHRSRLLGAG